MGLWFPRKGSGCGASINEPLDLLDANGVVRETPELELPYRSLLFVRRAPVPVDTEREPASYSLAAANARAGTMNTVASAIAPKSACWADVISTPNHCENCMAP